MEFLVMFRRDSGSASERIDTLYLQPVGRATTETAGQVESKIT